jgi:hypothetical protein
MVVETLERTFAMDEAPDEIANIPVQRREDGRVILVLERAGFQPELPEPDVAPRQPP